MCVLLCTVFTFACGGNKAETTESMDATMVDSTAGADAVMDDASDDATLADDQAADSGSGIKATVVTKEKDPLRMRAMPDIGSGVIGTIPNGTTIEILGEDDKTTTIDGQSGKWMKVRYNNQEGWAWSGFLQKQ
jgi:hypothetical protein